MDIVFIIYIFARDFNFAFALKMFFSTHYPFWSMRSDPSLLTAGTSVVLAGRRAAPTMGYGRPDRADG